MPEEKIFVNTEMSRELVKMLDAMCESDEQTRSGFIRMLVKAEHKRRQSQTTLPRKTKVV